MAMKYLNPSARHRSPCLHLTTPSWIDMGTLAQGWTEEYFPPEAMATVVGKADRQSFKVGPPMDIFATGLITIQLLCRSPKPPTAPGVRYLPSPIFYA